MKTLKQPLKRMKMIKRLITKIVAFIKYLFSKKPDSSLPTFLLEENDDSDLMCVRIKGSIFNDVVFCFRKVAFQEPENKELSLTLKFEYDIMECPDENKLEEKLEEFEQMLGDYLITILEEGNEEIESKRTHNPLFAIDERDIYEEDTSVSSD